MGIFNKLTSTLLDEVAAFSPTVAEMRYKHLIDEYNQSIDENKENSEKQKKDTCENEVIHLDLSTIKTAKKSPKRIIQKDVNLPTISRNEFECTVQDYCNELYWKYPHMFTRSKKLNKTLHISKETIYLEHDDSLNQDGGVGFAITQKGIYCVDFLNKPQFVDYEELACSTIVCNYASGGLFIDEKRIAYIVPTRNCQEVELRKTILSEVKLLYDRISMAYAQIE